MEKLGSDAGMEMRDEDDCELNAPGDELCPMASVKKLDITRTKAEFRIFTTDHPQTRVPKFLREMYLPDSQAGRKYLPDRHDCINRANKGNRLGGCGKLHSGSGNH